MTGTRVESVARFSLTSADPARLAAFYVAALGFVATGKTDVAAASYGAGTGRAEAYRLRLGAQEIELVGFEQPGAPYPVDRSSHDAWFQHLALVTADMQAAVARLATVPGWVPISRGGPVLLPATSGGVTAFKFRDPEGHPLELLAFPAGGMPEHWASVRLDGPCLGIDHSAIAVADSGRSTLFYEALGLAVSSRSLNQGPGQVRLDDADEVEVEVVGLSPPQARPHLELLAYRIPVVRPGRAGPADIACTRSVLVPSDPAASGRLIEDPDGHRILLAGV